MVFTLFLLIAIYGVITLIALPFQYRYLISLKEFEKQNQDKAQHELYDSMKFEEMYLHANAQGNPFLFLATIIAASIYKIKHRHKNL